MAGVVNLLYCARSPISYTTVASFILAYFISSPSCLNMSFANKVVNNTRNGLFVEFQLFSDFCWPFIL